MSAQEYGRDALSAATRHIETSSDALRVRVKQAVVSNLMELHPENLPDGLWPELSTILERLQRSKPREDEGTVEASLRHMPDNEVEEIAARIAKLSLRVTSG